MHKRRKSMLGKRNLPREPLVPIPIPPSELRRGLGSASSKRKSTTLLTKPRVRPLVFSPALNSTRKDETEFRELRPSTDYYNGVKRNLFPTNEHLPRYQSSPVENIASGPKFRTSYNTQCSYADRLTDPPDLVQSASSKRFTHLSFQHNNVPNPCALIKSCKKPRELQERNTFSRTPVPLKNISSTYKCLPAPNLIMSSSLEKFTCIENEDTPRVRNPQTWNDKQSDVAAAVVKRVLFSNNSDSACGSDIGRISRVQYGPSTSNDISAAKRQEIVENQSDNFLCRTKLDLHPRLSTISERTENSSGIEREFSNPTNTSKNVREQVSSIRNLEKEFKEESKKFSQSERKSQLAGISSSKLPVVIKSRSEEKNDSTKKFQSENKTVSTKIQKPLSKNSFSTVNLKNVTGVKANSCIDDVFQSLPEERMTRLKLKRTLPESEVMLESNKKFCSGNSNLTGNELNKSDQITDTSKYVASTSKYLTESRNVSDRLDTNNVYRIAQTSLFGSQTESKCTISVSTQTNETLLDRGDMFRQLLGMKTILDKLLDDMKMNAENLSDENSSSLSKTPLRRSQRIASRMSIGSEEKTPESSSKLNKSLHLYKELKSDFKFLRTPGKSVKKTPKKSPGRGLSDKIHTQLKMLYD